MWISLEDASFVRGHDRGDRQSRGRPDAVEAETRNPDDDYLIALARTHDVDVTVSRDKDVLEWESQRLPVVTPTRFENRDSAI